MDFVLENILEKPADGFRWLFQLYVYIILIKQINYYIFILFIN